MKKRLLHRLALLLILLAVWYVFSGVNSLVFLCFGLFSAAFALFIAERMDVADHEGHPLHLALTIPFYWLWLVKEMMKSTWDVTCTVWNPKLNIRPKLAWLPMTQTNDLGRTIYANSITLTPGTVCVDITKDRVLVHALNADSITETEAGEMDRRIAALTADKG